MKHLHCDGCQVTELESMPKHKIKSVILEILADPRFPEGILKYEADLCPNCQERILSTYFNVHSIHSDAPLSFKLALNE